MAVREDEVINPGGGRNLYGHIHFKNRAVAIVPLDCLDFALDEIARTLADGHHGRHGPDANHNPQHGQPRAQLVLG